MNSGSLYHVSRDGSVKRLERVPFRTRLTTFLLLGVPGLAIAAIAAFVAFRISGSPIAAAFWCLVAVWTAVGLLIFWGERNTLFSTAVGIYLVPSAVAAGLFVGAELLWHQWWLSVVLGLAGSCPSAVIGRVRTRARSTKLKKQIAEFPERVRLTAEIAARKAALAVAQPPVEADAAQVEDLRAQIGKLRDEMGPSGVEVFEAALDDGSFAVGMIEIGIQKGLVEVVELPNVLAEKEYLRGLRCRSCGLFVVGNPMGSLPPGLDAAGEVEKLRNAWSISCPHCDEMWQVVLALPVRP